MTFFGRHGNEFTVGNRAQLAELLDTIDITVPQRSRGRTTEHRERYCIVKYLRHLGENHLLEFPLTVIKNQPGHRSPDFIARSQPTGQIGIEHTDAAPESYQKAEAIMELEPNVVGLNVSYYAANPEISTIEDLKKGFIYTGGIVKGRGWLNDEAERQWVDFIAAAIRAKEEKISAGSYDPCNGYDVIVYDNTPVQGIHYVKALAILRAQAAAFPRIRKVSVLDDRAVFYDVLSFKGGS